jgi:hypothetical protein
MIIALFVISMIHLLVSCHGEAPFPDESTPKYQKISVQELQIFLDGLIPRGIAICDLMRCFQVDDTPEKKVILYESEYFPAEIEGYSSTDDIKREITEVFSKAFAQNHLTFHYFEDENYGPKFIDYENQLYLNIDKGDFGAMVVWPTETLQIVYQSEVEIVVSMERYYIIVDDEKSESERKELRLIKEDGQWKIDSSLMRWTD